MVYSEMTPEEVLRYGKRILLFPKARSKGREIFFVKDGRLVQQGKLMIDGQRVDIVNNSMYIEDIYPYIEAVYSQISKGVLIARRPGNRESNKRQLLPLRKTGKGMGHMIRCVQPLEVYNQLEFVQQEKEKRQERRHYQEKFG
jgi:hypothetical protein